MIVEANGIRLAVDVLGAETAPAMIVHHGAPGLGSRAEPLRSFGAFSDVLRVVAYDARGSGESGHDGPFTHAQWVADLEALRTALGLGPVVLAGGSYGGFIAMEYALRHPRAVRALILRDTAADQSFHAQAVRTALRSSRVHVDPDKLDRIMSGRCVDDADLAACWREIAPLYDHELDRGRVVERLATTVYHAATHNAAFARNLPAYDLTADLHRVACPTLVVVGRSDWITPVEASERIATLIPDARLCVFERSGHSPPQEEPERFQAVVRDFLAEAGILGS